MNCSCRAGKMEGGCKHILAVILFINSDKGSASKTDAERQWGKPKNKNIYKKAEKVRHMAGEPKSSPAFADVKEFPLKYEDLLGIDSPLLMTLKSEQKSIDEIAVEDTVANLINSVIEEIKSDEVQKLLLRIMSLQSMDCIYSSKSMKITTAGALYYNTNIAVSEARIIEIATLTILQSKTPEWQKIRQCRVSATKAYSIVVRKKNFDELAAKFVMDKKFQSEATNYGIQKEQTAFAEFEGSLIEGFQVSKVGVIIKKSQPWLCCSPDGILVNQSANIHYILEIKCPFTCRTKPVFDREKNISNVPYLQLDNEKKLQLKRSDKIYYQIQILLYVCNAQVCFLYVYSPKGSETIKVSRDESFLQDIVPKMENFYFGHFLPALVN